MQVFPPIYVNRLIPGEISVEEKEYDAAALMKVDADTWSLLQSTHQRMTRGYPILECFAILVLLVGLFPVLALLVFTPYFGFVNMYAFLFIADLVYGCAVDDRNPRVYEEVTKAVNSALQKARGRHTWQSSFMIPSFPDEKGNLAGGINSFHACIRSKLFDGNFGVNDYVLEPSNGRICRTAEYLSMPRNNRGRVTRSSPT